MVVTYLKSVGFTGPKTTIGTAFADLDKEATGFRDAQPVRAML